MQISTNIYVLLVAHRIEFVARGAPEAPRTAPPPYPRTRRRRFWGGGRVRAHRFVQVSVRRAMGWMVIARARWWRFGRGRGLARVESGWMDARFGHSADTWYVGWSEIMFVGPAS